MNVSGTPRVMQPLRELATQSPGDLFAIVARVQTDPGADLQGSFDASARALDAVEAAIRALGVSFGTPGPGAAGERIVWNGSASQAPVLYARLTGAHVLQLDAQLDERVSVAISRDINAARPGAGAFDPGDLLRRVIAEPLASAIRKAPDEPHHVIVTLDANHPQGQIDARAIVGTYLAALGKRTTPIDYRINAGASHPYVYATMTGAQILALVELDRNPATAPVAINRIWEDHEVSALITRSIATVKADAAQIAYSAAGKGIVWAVLDSGIDGTHPHFAMHKNLDLSAIRPIRHRDFVGPQTDAPPPLAVTDDAGALLDPFGHGTHVAGIIAGAWRAPVAPPDGTPRPAIICTTRDEAGADERSIIYPPVISGMAPECTLVSMRVLDEYGAGRVTAIIDAFEAIQQINGYGRRIVIHGVNLSAGYAFDAKWFACGRSPLCDEVDRLVRSGVVVVVAAGNSGYGDVGTLYNDTWAATLAQTINDPGNAELAITVGSTHRESPHRYGVSYFSSKGPTGDGRLKPDLVAPGERIVSCASTQARLPVTTTADDGTAATVAANDYTYREDSGTSMAAPHVAGVIAAFLSIRAEYVGLPESVKTLFVNNAVDLGRDRAFQGSGLVDLMRSIAAV